MIKNYNQFNESLRDKMKPKSEEDISNAYDKYFIKFDNCCADFPAEHIQEYKDVADKLDSNLNDLHLITESDDDYVVFRNLFFELTENEKDFEYIEVLSEHGVQYDGKWKCYPKQKVAIFITKVFIKGEYVDDITDNWIFNKPYLKELITK